MNGSPLSSSPHVFLDDDDGDNTSLSGVILDAGDDDDDALLSALAFIDAHHSPDSPDSPDSPVAEEAPTQPTVISETNASAGIVVATSASSQQQQNPNQQHQHRQLAKKRSGPKPKVSSSVSNRARDARREEVIYLRKKVAELELQLAANREKCQALQHQPSDSAELSEDEPMSPASPRATEPGAAKATGGGGARKRRASRQQPTSLWQEIVSRQCEQRVKAERENIRLKLVLENQLKVARGLEKMLQKTTSTKEFEKLLHGHPRFHWAMDSPVPPPDESDARLVSELLAGLDESYLEAEAVFEANGLARATGSTRIDAVVRPDERFGIQLEVFASKVLPFDMRSTGTVAWNHYAHSRDRLPNRAYRRNAPQTMNAAEDTIVEDFNLEIDLNNSNAWYRGRLAMRRYVEEHRVMIVWREYFDTLLIASEPAGGMRFLERGYVVIRDAPVQPPCDQHHRQREDASPSVVMQICYLASPVTSGNLANANMSKIDMITDFEICATAANIASTHEMIETGLLQQAIKSRWGLDHQHVPGRTR